MNLTVIGTGYVGLVTGACFAEMGHHVTCVDSDATKIGQLKNGTVPIHEPGIEPMIRANLAGGRLQFTTSLADAMTDSHIYFIAVGTPAGDNGSADLSNVHAVAHEIGRNLHRYAVVIIKSTVPVGTAETVRKTITDELATRGVNIDFDMVSNPEFLKQGAAVEDCLKPDRIIIGTDSERAAQIMHRLYAPFTRDRERTLAMGIRDAEMTKYAANAMLATKISFINEIAALCDQLDVDVENVRLGIGSDPRIGFSFIYPGCGYGGHCFPKDVKALAHTAQRHGIDAKVLNAVDDRNQRQRKILFEKISARFGTTLKELTFGIWGLAFKPDTDDMREAPSIDLIEALIEAGAKVRAFDPAATEVARRILPEEWFTNSRLTLADQQYDAVEQVDALILVTEWKPFRNLDYPLLRTKMRQPIIFDGRNQYDPKEVVAEGFEYTGIGRRG